MYFRISCKEIRAGEKPAFVFGLSDAWIEKGRKLE